MATNGDNISGTVKYDDVDVSAGEVPKKAVDLNSVEPDQAEESPAVAAAETSGGSLAAGEIKKDEEISKDSVPITTREDGPVNDVQKKIRRAERFGLPVKLSEKEKRNSRAERFGTAPPKSEQKAPEKPDELKRKARAERFGLPVSSAPSDEEAKKKARLARFEPGVKTDSIEEEKRKARAIRFSNPSKAPSRESPQKNIDKVAAIVENSV